VVAREIPASAVLRHGERAHVISGGELLPTMPVDPAHSLSRITQPLASYLDNVTKTNSSIVFKCTSDKRGYFEREGSSCQWHIELNGHALDETQSKNLQITIIIKLPG
jgi:hypothetical protein